MPLAIAAREVSKQQANAISGTIRNISIRGVYFTTDHDVTPGCDLDLTFVLPKELTQGPEVLVRARSRVLRVEAADSSHGVAAVIETYEIVRAKNGAA